MRCHAGLTAPVDPSTMTTMPSVRRDVTSPHPTTAEIPYSRAMIDPRANPIPTSVTRAATLPRSGVQAGAVSDDLGRVGGKEIVGHAEAFADERHHRRDQAGLVSEVSVDGRDRDACHLGDRRDRDSSRTARHHGGQRPEDALPRLFRLPCAQLRVVRASGIESGHELTCEPCCELARADRRVRALGRARTRTMSGPGSHRVGNVQTETRASDGLRQLWNDQQ